jgi:hypothetical protein
MTEIEVRTIDPGEEIWSFEVVVRGDAQSQHQVTMRRLDFERLTGEATKVGQMAGPEAFIEATFRFLLARERQGSIRKSFDITDISRYFPEYEQEMVRRYGSA